MTRTNDTRYLLQEKYSDKKSLGFYADLIKLRFGYPLAYILGWQPFLELKIDLKYKPLIPRPETEYWLQEYVLNDNLRPAIKVLDIFAGSGCMGLAFAKRFPNSTVTLADVNAKFIKQIQKNAEINEVPNIKIVKSNVFQNIKDKFDIILANPPYIALNGKTSFAPSLIYENKRSLFAKKHGLFFIEKLIFEAQDFLNSKGSMFIEFDPWQKHRIEQLILNSRKWDSYKFLKDQYGFDRVVKLCK